MKKVIIGLSVLVLLLIGAVIFIVTHKNDQVSKELLTNVQLVEADTSSDPVLQVKASSADIETKSQNVIAQKSTSSVSPINVTQTRAPVSSEERQNCIKWQVARNASGVKPVLAIDGICQDKPYTQEYLSSSPTVETPIAMKTYTSANYGFSFKYPDTQVCGEKLTSSAYKNTIVKQITITCGNKNLDGGVADKTGGQIDLLVDGGTSTFRTSFRERASEANAITVGGNKFYPGTIGRTLERPNYLFVATDFDRFVYTSHFVGIDLTSLRFQ